MSLSDDVREHCRARYVQPARDRGESAVTITVGDVHAALGYANRHSLICAALGTRTFEELCGLERTDVSGPLNAASTSFTFRLL